MNKKLLYLSVALILPIAVFIFLRLFGNNHFDIPIYYQAGVDACGKKIPGPYSVPDSILSNIGWESGKSGLLLVNGTKADLKYIDRLLEELHPDSLQVKQINSNDSINTVSYMLTDRLEKWKKCLLFLEVPYNTILIDKQRRIRGYYLPSKREEMDRLTIEAKILIEHYGHD